MEEEQELTRLEAIIERGLETFLEVGTALLKIREVKLYRRDYKTFADYCRGRWGKSRGEAYRLIDAVEVASNIKMSPIGDIQELPKTENVVRPLVSLTPEDQRAAWTEACNKANGHPTAEQVKQAVDKVVPSERRQKRKKKSAAEKLAERIGGMRIAFDGALVPDDCTDDDRRRHLQELNQLRDERDQKISEWQKENLQAKPEKEKPAKAKPLTEDEQIAASFRKARPRFMIILKQHFRPSQYARVCELLTQTINKQKQ
jgi:hypothetical protein